MGLRGPKPTPTETLRARGSPLANRNPGEPVFPVGVPEPPPGLHPLALEEWHRVVPELEAAGVLNRVSRAALVAYCELWAEWQRLKAQVEKEGERLKNADGAVYINPLLYERNRARRECIQAMAEFGMTPASASRVTAASEPTKPRIYSRPRA